MTVDRNNKNSAAIIPLLLFGIVAVLIWFKINSATSPKVFAPQPYVKVVGRQLLEDFDKDGVYNSYFIKGVAYNPMPIGRHPSDWGWKQSGKVDNIFDDEDILRRDFALLKEMHCNTIRIWKGDDTFNPAEGRFPIRLTQKTLDLAEVYGLKVIAGFWINTSPSKCQNFAKAFQAPNFEDAGIRKDYVDRFVRYVQTFKNHPALLFWAIGNENNYHLNPDDYNQVAAFYSLINEMAQAAHAAEGDAFHPVAFVNGDIHTVGEILYKTTDDDLPGLDIWGANVYRGQSLGDLFGSFSKRSAKPLWISEFGIDAFYADDYNIPERGHEDQETQSAWVGAVWDEIAAHQDLTVGGTVMEYSDEWWKPDEWLDAGVHNATHDYFESGPQDVNCDGYIDWYPPAPDKFFHQEWFGIMAIAPGDTGCDQMIPRKVYYTLQEKFGKL